MNLGSLFRWIGRLAKKAFGFAKAAGLDDILIGKALELVKQAAGTDQTNHAKREWVVAGLQALGIKESIARLAVELAYQIFKREGSHAA